MRTMSLLERLSEADRLRLHNESDSLIAALRQVQAAKKIEMARVNAEIKVLNGRIWKINDNLMTGKMSKDVGVEERFDYKAGKAVTFRTDTGEQIAERAIVPGERQLPIPDPTEAANPELELAEDQDAAETPEEAEAARALRLAAQRDAARASQTAKSRVDSVVSKVIILLPGESGNGKFTAKIGALAGFPWGDAGCTADGETADEARTKLMSFMLAKVQDQEEELDKRWVKSIALKVDGLLATRTIDDVPNEDGQFVATVILADKIVSGAGPTQTSALTELRTCIVEAFREEVATLARQQAEEAGKGARKLRGLRAPTPRATEAPAPTTDGAPADGTAF